MEMRVVYCSACDREVEVILRDGHESTSADPDFAGMVCLDIGEHCTGTSCPVCASPPEDAARTRQPAEA